MAEEGLPFSPRTMTHNSRLAQELAKWAETQSGGAGIHDALYRAYFVDGLNIALIDNLLTIVRQLGLPEPEARDVLASRRFRDAVDEDWRRCRSLGVMAVPTFVGRNGLLGRSPTRCWIGWWSKAGLRSGNGARLHRGGCSPAFPGWADDLVVTFDYTDAKGAVTHRVVSPIRDGQPHGPVRYFWLAVLPRNLLFLIAVLRHGFRRLAPPY